LKKVMINVGDTEFSAFLLETEAPMMTKAFWDILPIESDLHHAKIAGNEVFCAVFAPRMNMPDKLENRIYISEGKPGDIFACGYNLGLIYGETASERFPVNVFAHVTEEGELEKMRKACIGVWRKNGQKITMRKSLDFG